MQRISVCTYNREDVREESLLCFWDAVAYKKKYQERTGKEAYLLKVPYGYHVVEKGTEKVLKKFSYKPMGVDGYITEQKALK